MPEGGQTFEAYLLQTARVPSKYVPYYVRWVQRFQQSKEASHLERQQALVEFRSHLSQSYQPWQVNQAGEAVKHYWLWLDRSHSPAGSISVPNEGLAELVAEARRLLRLQHKSYRTEQTYLGWMRRFLVFVKQVDRSAIDQTHLRHYLTFLAVELRVSSATQQQAFNALLFSKASQRPSEHGSRSDYRSFFPPMRYSACSTSFPDRAASC